MIAVAGDAVDGLEALGEGAGQRGVDFRFGPEIIFSFLAFGLGVEAGGESACPASCRAAASDGFLDALARQGVAVELPDMLVSNSISRALSASIFSKCGTSQRSSAV